MDEMTTARQEELLQTAAYMLMREKEHYTMMVFASWATESLPGNRVRKLLGVEDPDRMAWRHARGMFVVLLDCITFERDERDFLLARFPTMSMAFCIAQVMDGVRQMQEKVDRDPWTFGVVQDRDYMVERGILTAVEAWDNLADILSGDILD